MFVFVRLHVPFYLPTLLLFLRYPRISVRILLLYLGMFRLIFFPLSFCVFTKLLLLLPHSVLVLPVRLLALLKQGLLEFQILLSLSILSFRSLLHLQFIHLVSPLLLLFHPLGVLLGLSDGVFVRLLSFKFCLL